MRIPKMNDVLVKYFNTEIKKNGISDDLMIILSHSSIDIPKKYLNDPLLCLRIIKNAYNFNILKKIPGSVQNMPEFIDGFITILPEAFEQIDLQISIIRRTVETLVSLLSPPSNVPDVSDLERFETSVTEKREEVIQEILENVKSDAIKLFIELSIR